MLADYRETGLSVGVHPLTLLRPHLASDVLASVELNERPHGSQVVFAGLAVARQRPSTAKGIVFMLLEDEVGARFDYVLMSAIFNNVMSDATSFLEALVERAWAHADRGLGFNFLSHHVNFSEDSMAYHDPARVLDFCIRRLSPRVRIEHHYQRCDVVVFVYR